MRSLRCRKSTLSGVAALTERPDGWEARLAEVLRDAASRAFDARAWNCARFAHRAAEAIRNQHLPYQFIGTSLEASVNAVLPKIPAGEARRGDIVLADVPHPTLGVCLGAQCAFVTRSGLVTQSRSVITAAWSV